MAIDHLLLHIERCFAQKFKARTLSHLICFWENAGPVDLSHLQTCNLHVEQLRLFHHVSKGWHIINVVMIIIENSTKKNSIKFLTNCGTSWQKNLKKTKIFNSFEKKMSALDTKITKIFSFKVKHIKISHCDWLLQNLLKDAFYTISLVLVVIFEYS